MKARNPPPMSIMDVLQMEEIGVLQIQGCNFAHVKDYQTKSN